jgi:nitroreductase
MSFNDISSTLSLLRSRRSGKPRDMSPSGPTDEQFRDILEIAQRVPDHGKLAPWRFVIVPEDRRTRLADVIEAAYRADKPAAPDFEIDGVRAYALQGARLVIILSTPVQPHKIPLWEQELSAGAVCQNFLIATHAHGFVGSWLSGWPAYSASVRQALGGSETDKIAGFMFIGSPTRDMEERPRPNFSDVVRTF